MAKQFDKEAWLETKQQKLDGAKKALEDGLKALQTSDDWKRMLEAMAVTGKLSIMRLSFRNQVLVFSQRPGTKLAATFMTWKEHGRSVKKGEKAMTILAPVIARRGDGADESRAQEEVCEPLKSERSTPNGEPRIVAFKPLATFSYDQTEGEELPKVKLPDIMAPEAFEGSLEKLTAVALALPGAPVSGIDVRPRAADDHSTALGWYEPKTKRIVVVSNDVTRSQQFHTLCHELAHALLHPLGDPHGAPEREVEAESTAFVVCHALGVDTGAASFPYVATWARRQDRTPEGVLQMVATSGQRIATAAARILDALCDHKDEAAETAA